MYSLTIIQIFVYELSAYDVSLLNLKSFYNVIKTLITHLKVSIIWSGVSMFNREILAHNLHNSRHLLIKQKNNVFFLLFYIKLNWHSLTTYYHCLALCLCGFFLCASNAKKKNQRRKKKFILNCSLSEIKLLFSNMMQIQQY